MLHRLRLAVKPFVPVALRGAAKRLALRLAALGLRGSRVACPCCGHSFRRFLRYPALYCPACGSYERQRFLCLVFNQQVQELLAGRRSVLHVGPEPCIRRRLERSGIDDYLSIDLDPRLAMRAMDVTALDLPDDHFELVFCGHVLDIVSDPDLALRELRRVLQPEGLALFQTPVQAQPELEERLARAALPSRSSVPQTSARRSLPGTA